MRIPTTNAPRFPRTVVAPAGRENAPTPRAQRVQEVYSDYYEKMDLRKDELRELVVNFEQLAKEEGYREKPIVTKIPWTTQAVLDGKADADKVFVHDEATYIEKDSNRDMSLTDKNVTVLLKNIGDLTDDETVTGDWDFSGDVTLSALTADRLVYTDVDKNVASVTDLTAWVAGTEYQVIVTDDTDGTLTLSTPQNIDTAARPQFANLGLGAVADATAQLKLAYDGTTYVLFTVDSSHDMTVVPTSTGQIKLQSTTDQADFFQVLDADGGTPVLNVDTVNERAGLGTAAPARVLEVVDASNAQIRATHTAGSKYVEFQSDSAGNLIITSNLGQMFKTDTTAGSLMVGEGAGDALQAGGNYHVLFGKNAGGAITTGDHCVAIGYEALAANLTSSYVVAIGSRCLEKATTAGHVGIGYYALNKNEDGAGNVAIGSSACQNNVSGDYLVGIGYEALKNVTNHGNIGIGTQALLANTSGVYSIGIGFQAGRYNQTGNRNISIGYRAGYGVSGNSFTGNIFIGYQAGNSITTGTYNIVMGYDKDLPAGTSNYHLNIGDTVMGDIQNYNVGIGGYTFGANSKKVLALYTDTAPGAAITDGVQLYSADFAAGHACLTLRNEDGDIIKLEQQNKADYNNWAAFTDVVDALVAMGIFDAA